MTKQTKMLLGLALVAGAGYFIWKKNKPATKGFASKKPKKSKAKAKPMPTPSDNPFEYTV
jgi:hypothetical protein